MHSQKTVITGAVNSKPVLNFDPAGKAICDFEVIVDRPRKDRQPDRTYFHVGVSGRRTQDCFSLLKVGDEVTVTGNVKASAAIDTSGKPCASINLFAISVEFSQEVWARKNNAQEGGHAAADL